MNPQTQVRMRSAAACPRFFDGRGTAVHVRDVMAKSVAPIAPTAAAQDAGNVQRRWQHRVRRGRVWFDKELREAHRKLRQSVPAYILEGNLLSLLTAPILYSLLLPLVLLDLWVTLYQSICFPIYGMTRVPRRRYFAIDRHKLAYLNGIEKVNCTFCSYANGLIAYVREVAARTEQYWCPIKHARAIAAPHQRYHGFLDYGDASGYRTEFAALRHAMKAQPHYAAGKRTPARRPSRSRV